MAYSIEWLRDPDNRLVFEARVREVLQEVAPAKLTTTALAQRLGVSSDPKTTKALFALLFRVAPEMQDCAERQAACYGPFGMKRPWLWTAETGRKASPLERSLSGRVAPGQRDALGLAQWLEGREYPLNPADITALYALAGRPPPDWIEEHREIYGRNQKWCDYVSAMLVCRGGGITGRSTAIRLAAELGLPGPAPAHNIPPAPSRHVDNTTAPDSMQSQERPAMSVE